MEGLMQDFPLTLHHILWRIERLFARKEIVTKTADGVHRYTWGELASRVHRLAHVLEQLGVKRGDRVATLAWNNYRHLEIYYAVAGSAAVIHTINPRLFPDQIAYIASHAEDRLVFFDTTFAPLVAKLAPQLKSVKAFVAMADRAHMPKEEIPNLFCYEELVDA